MKKKMCVFVLILFLGVSAAGYGQTTTLDMAISGAWSYVEEKLAHGINRLTKTSLTAQNIIKSEFVSRAFSVIKNALVALLSKSAKVMVINTAADGPELGAYVAKELAGLLSNGKYVNVVNQTADVVQALTGDTGYLKTGDAGAALRQAAQRAGADVLISGIMSGIQGADDKFRLTLKLVLAKTGVLVGQYSANVQSDTVMNSLSGIPQPVQARASSGAARGVQADGTQAGQTSAVNAASPAGTAANTLAGEQFAQAKPRWISRPIAARAEFDDAGTGVSRWYYSVGVSHKTASQQLARRRASQDIQLSIAERIASDMVVRVDLTAVSEFLSSEIEDVKTRIETSLVNTIRTRVPAFEVLEWHDEVGKNAEGKEWHMAYALVRISRKNILGMLGKIDKDRVADAAVKALNIPEDAAEEAKGVLLLELEGAQEAVQEGIEEGFGGS